MWRPLLRPPIAETSSPDVRSQGRASRAAQRSKTLDTEHPGNIPLETIKEARRELARGAADVEPEVDRQRPREGHSEAAREPVVRAPPVENRRDAGRERRVRDRKRLAGRRLLRREARRDAVRRLAVIADPEREARVVSPGDVLDADPWYPDARRR